MEKGNIYSFKVNKKIKKKVETTKKNKDGEDEIIITNKTVKTPVEFVIKRPSRRIAEEAEIHYAVELSKAIKLGLLTKAMLVKKYSDNGGALTEEETKELMRSLKKIHDLENKLMHEKASGNSDTSELESEILKLKKDLIELESSVQGVYQHTADARAERQTLLWYAVNLTSCKNKDGDFEPYFEGMDYDQRLEDLYEKDESEDEYHTETLGIILKTIGYWFYSQGASEEDIKKFIQSQEKLEKEEGLKDAHTG